MQLTPEFTPYHAPRVIGSVYRWAAVPSVHLAHPRDVLVWLPPDYEEAPTRRYPVLYLHDGQNKFDPSTSFAGDDWNIDGIATEGIRTGDLEPFIMVAIYNSPDRLYEYNPLVRGRAYGRFIIEELRPIIDREFRTQPGRHSAVLGSSMGGLISLALLFWHPDHFFGAACLSPSLWVLRWQHAGGVAGWLRKQPRLPQPTWLYLDHGTEGYEGRGDRVSKEVLDVLARRGWPDDHLMYHVAEGGHHNEASWRDRVALPLRFLFGRGRPDG